MFVNKQVQESTLLFAILQGGGEGLVVDYSAKNKQTFWCNLM